MTKIKYKVVSFYSKNINKTIMLSHVNGIQTSTTNTISHLLNKKDDYDHWGQLMASYRHRFEQPTTRLKVQLELQTLLLQHTEK